MTAKELEDLCLSYVNRAGLSIITTNVRLFHNLIRKDFAKFWSNWWFLEVIPSAITILPSSTYALFGGWFLQGWLVTQPGTADYAIRTGANTTYVKCSAATFVKEYSLSTGGFVGDKVVYTDVQKYMQDFNVLTQSTVQKVLFFNAADGKSYLRFQATPSARKFYAIGYKMEFLADVAAGGAGDSLSDVLTTVYSDAIIAGLNMKLFHSVGETNQFADWRDEWIYKLEWEKTEEKRKKASAVRDLPMYRGTKTAIGYQPQVIETVYNP